MKLWTVQPSHVYERWRSEGVFRTDSHAVDEAFVRPYQWMVRQMKKRLPPAPKDCHYPVWAWFQARSLEKRRPDLRANGHLPRGQDGVMLTLDVEDRLVLLSDFDLWHLVLNDAYLPASIDEDESGVGVLEKAQSWNRIFDLGFSAPQISDPFPDKIIQATFWELRLDHVISIQHFKAR